MHERSVILAQRAEEELAPTSTGEESPLPSRDNTPTPTMDGDSATLIEILESIPGIQEVQLEDEPPEEGECAYVLMCPLLRFGVPLS